MLLFFGQIYKVSSSSTRSFLPQTQCSPASQLCATHHNRSDNNVATQPVLLHLAACEFECRPFVPEKLDSDQLEMLSDQQNSGQLREQPESLQKARLVPTARLESERDRAPQQVHRQKRLDRPPDQLHARPIGQIREQLHLFEQERGHSVQ